MKTASSRKVDDDGFIVLAGRPKRVIAWENILVVKKIVRVRRRNGKKFKRRILARIKKIYGDGRPTIRCVEKGSLWLDNTNIALWVFSDRWQKIGAS